MSRWKASSIHLVISAIIAAAVLALMLLVWYPNPIFEAVGGQQVFLILLGVDVVLGPLITLLIFNVKKSRKELAMDLSVVAMVQIAALIYGMGVVFKTRPVYLVFSADSFDLVNASMLSDDDLAKARYPEFRSLPLAGPVYVYSEMPVDPEERNEVVRRAYSGKDLSQLPQYYKPYADHMAAVARLAKPLAVLKELNPNRIAEIEDVARASGGSEAALGFVPLRVKGQSLAVLVEKNTGKVQRVVNMRPW